MTDICHRTVFSIIAASNFQKQFSENASWGRAGGRLDELTLRIAQFSVWDVFVVGCENSRSQLVTVKEGHDSNVRGAEETKS